MRDTRIIGIDAGNLQSGMVVLDCTDSESDIIGAFNLQNEPDLFSKVTEFSQHPNLIVVIEDIRPYSLRLTPQVIDTCKFIGEAVYRLKKVQGLNAALCSRFEVKKWIFDTYPDQCLQLIDGKNEKKMFDACDIKSREQVRIDKFGKAKRKPSFISVDDRIVEKCMQFHFNIEKPPAGKGYKYGLQTHSWQALALSLMYFQTKIGHSI